LGRQTHGKQKPKPKLKMKITRILQLVLVVTLLGLALPARAETMSVPSKEKAAYTFDVPSDWKPKGDASDESVEATAPEDAAYVLAWIRKGSDLKGLTKDLDATLADAMKSVDKDTKESEVDQNGSHFYVISGTGLDKRAGNKVKFLVGIFDAGNDRIGIVYADADDDAPASTMTQLKGILDSIKVKK
jgi:hypothetical protein